MPTINANPGEADSNSYATLEEAAAYADTHIAGSVWTAADTDSKTRALITATRLLDEHFIWNGYVTSGDQALQWPRTWVPDGRAYYGLSSGMTGYLDGDTIPPGIRDACAELARQLLLSDRTADDDVETKGITEISAGSVDVKFTGYTKAKVIPDAVYAMVRLWGKLRNRSSMNVPLSRA